MLAEIFLESARRLVELRDGWLSAEPDRTLTGLYNSKPRWFEMEHVKLDTLVLDAYGLLERTRYWVVPGLLAVPMTFIIATSGIDVLIKLMKADGEIDGSVDVRRFYDPEISAK